MLTKITLNIEAGERLDPTLLSAQATAAKTKLTELIASLVEVSKPIKALNEDTKLVGDSYTKEKKQINSYRKIIKSITTAAEAEIKDYETLIEKCENVGEILDGTTIIQLYSNAVDSENANRTTAADYQRKADDCWDILFISKMYYKLMAKKYTQLADNDVALANQYIAKADKYAKFEQETKKLFTESKKERDNIDENLKKLYRAQKGLKNIQSKTGNYYNIIPGIINYYPASFAKYYEINANYIRQIKSCDYEKLRTEIEFFKKLYYDNIDTYKEIEAATGVPAELIALIHYRESGGDFNTYLHNGEKLGHVTQLVPKGIYFTDFKEAAIDALNRNNKKFGGNLFNGTTDMATMLTFAEAFNGFGYANHNHVSPYLYSGTDVYKSGKYVKDGKYDPDYVDKQAGAYILIKSLSE